MSKRNHRLTSAVSQSQRRSRSILGAINEICNSLKNVNAHQCDKLKQIIVEIYARDSLFTQFANSLCAYLYVLSVCRCVCALLVWLAIAYFFSSLHWQLKYRKCQFVFSVNSPQPKLNEILKQEKKQTLSFQDFYLILIYICSNVIKTKQNENTKSTMTNKTSYCQHLICFKLNSFKWKLDSLHLNIFHGTTNFPSIGNFVLFLFLFYKWENNQK